MDCIFCKIASGQIPAKKVYENEKVLAFDDINPLTPAHTLVIPREHIVDLNDINSGNSAIMSDIFLAVKEVVKIKDVDESGYRILINNGRDAHQEVFHLHVHIFGGRDLGPMIKKG